MAGLLALPPRPSLARHPVCSKSGSYCGETGGRILEHLRVAVDGLGQLYFVDGHQQRIYRWSAEKKAVSIVRDNPLDPVNLVFDKAGNLIVSSSGGKGMTVYSFRPGWAGRPDHR